MHPPYQPDSRRTASATLAAECETAPGSGTGRVVITQPMYFPWVGILEQARLADIFVHYEDVQFSKGSFSNRVQVKTATGMHWLTVPLRSHVLGQAIDEVEIDYRPDWARSHRDKLKQAYAGSAFRSDMLDLVDEVFSRQYPSLAELSKASTMCLLRYFGLDHGRLFVDSPQLAIGGSGSRRVVDTCLRLGACRYLTGHGARHYLQHEAFEAAGIDVEYIEYGLVSYPQMHGPFTPYVTALDLVAHCGQDGASSIAGKPVAWRDFLAATGKP